VFKALLAATTAVIVGVGLSVVGIASTASAADVSSGCLPDSAVSFTYNASTNGGVVSVAGDPGQQLCDPFWITAVSWKFSASNGSDLPQTLEKYTTTRVINSGETSYGSAVTCGQGDIVATRAADAVIPQGSLSDFNSSFLATGDFNFLNWMGYNWTNPLGAGHDTWTQSRVDGNISCLTPGDPSATSVCTDGVSQGSISVDFKPNFVYSIAGIEASTGHQILIPTVSSATTSVPLGTYQVSVKAADGWGLITGNTTWPYPLTVSPAEDCADLPTDAVLPAAVTSTDAVCTSEGDSVGTITVGQVDGEDTTPYIQYSIDGVPVTGITTSVAAGTHVVTAVAKTGSSIESGTYSQPDGSAKFTVSIAATGEICGASLKTLALTGTDSTGVLLLAFLMLQFGLVLIAVRFVLARRES
jgi:hypothetical protein